MGSGKVYRYDLPVNFDGFQTTQDIDVSNFMPDARLALWVLYDTTFTEIAGAVSIIDAQTVRLTVSPAPIEGNYQLLGLA